MNRISTNFGTSFRKPLSILDTKILPLVGIHNFLPLLTVPYLIIAENLKCFCVKVIYHCVTVILSSGEYWAIHQSLVCSEPGDGAGTHQLPGATPCSLCRQRYQSGTQTIGIINPLTTTSHINGEELCEFLLTQPFKRFEKFLLCTLPPVQTYGAKHPPSPSHITENWHIAQGHQLAGTCILAVVILLFISRKCIEKYVTWTIAL